MYLNHNPLVGARCQLALASDDIKLLPSWLLRLLGSDLNRSRAAGTWVGTLEIYLDAQARALDAPCVPNMRHR